MSPRSLAVAAALLLAAAGCRRSNGRDDGPPPAASESAAPSASAETTSASAPEATTSPPPTASAATASPGLSGSWTGAYDAKRATVKLSKATPWPAWKRDAGKQVGKGTLELDIDEAGEVRGKASGALGPLVLAGRVEDGVLRATVLPEDPLAEATMSGVATGELKGSTLHVTLRVSNRRGEAVRSADATLKRK